MRFIKFLSLILTLSACTTAPNPTIEEPTVSIATKTIYVQFAGPKNVAAKVMNQLTLEQPCIAMHDGCHAFLPYPTQAKLRDSENPVYKVVLAPKAGAPGKFSMEAFLTEGKKLVRYFNPGEFRIPSDHQITEGDKDFSEERFVVQMSA
jgi:hypothetical protein